MALSRRTHARIAARTARRAAQARVWQPRGDPRPRCDECCPRQSDNHAPSRSAPRRRASKPMRIHWRGTEQLARVAALRQVGRVPIDKQSDLRHTRASLSGRALAALLDQRQVRDAAARRGPSPGAAPAGSARGPRPAPRRTSSTSGPGPRRRRRRPRRTA